MLKCFFYFCVWNFKLLVQLPIFLFKVWMGSCEQIWCMYIYVLLCIFNMKALTLHDFITKYCTCCLLSYFMWGITCSQFPLQPYLNEGILIDFFAPTTSTTTTSCPPPSVTESSKPPEHLLCRRRRSSKSELFHVSGCKVKSCRYLHVSLMTMEIESSVQKLFIWACIFCQNLISCFHRIYSKDTFLPFQCVCLIEVK